MALWLAIQAIKIGIFDQLGQASWLFSFIKKIRGFGRRRNVNAKGNASRGATRFGSVAYTFQYIYCGMSSLVFVDTHYNKYTQLESQTIREARRSYRSVGWLAAELLALKRAIVS
jgi:hypothetical protein